MRKWIIVLIILLLGTAYLTRPDDKTCIIEGVRAVWGDAMPDVNQYPAYFEQFMNVNSGNVEVKDWLLFKQIRYKLQAQEKTVAYGAFKNVFPTVKPLEMKEAVPRMPPQK